MHQRKKKFIIQSSSEHNSHYAEWERKTKHKPKIIVEFWLVRESWKLSPEGGGVRIHFYDNICGKLENVCLLFCQLDRYGAGMENRWMQLLKLRFGSVAA